MNNKIQSKITLEDLKKLFKEEKVIKSEINSSLYIFNRVETKGISYTNILFDISDSSKEEMQIISILTYAYPMMSSNNTPYSVFSKNLLLYGLSLNFSLYPIDRYDNENKIQKVYFKISFKCLNEDLNKFLSLLCELFFDGNYTDENMMLMTEKDIKGTFDFNLKYDKENLFIKTALKRFSLKHKVLDITSGISFSSYIRESNFKKEFDKAKKLIQKVLKKNRMIFFHSSDIQTDITSFVNSFDYDTLYVDKEVQIVKDDNDLSPLLYSFDTEMSFNSQVFKTLYENSSFSCLSSLLDSGVLWNLVRLKGKAYGVGSLYLNTGVFQLYSFSDPNIKKTFKYFKKALLSKIDDEEFILSKKTSLSFLSDSHSIYNKISLSLSRFISNYSDEKRVKFIDSVIKLKKDDITDAKNSLLKSDYILSTVSNDNNLNKFYKNCNINRINL